MWGRNMMLMQVCYVTKQRFHSFNLGKMLYSMKGTLTYLGIWAVSIGLYLTGASSKTIHYFFIFAVGLQLFVLLEFIVSFLSQAKQVLGIQIFSIPYPPKTEVKKD
jgi:hypothetical protein